MSGAEALVALRPQIISAAAKAGSSADLRCETIELLEDTNGGDQEGVSNMTVGSSNSRHASTSRGKAGPSARKNEKPFGCVCVGVRFEQRYDNSDQHKQRWFCMVAATCRQK